MADDDMTIVQVQPDLIEELCTWSDDPDEHRRVFVLINFPSDVEKMEKISQWLKDGLKPAMKVVK